MKTLAVPLVLNEFRVASITPDHILSADDLS